MVRYLLPIPLLSSCVSLSLEMPYREVVILAPEDGAIVPDTFTLSIFAYDRGPVLRKEIVYGFPDGPVERGRFPGCYRFEAVVRVDGREVERYEGCDSLTATVKVKARGEKVRVELRVGGTVRRATYTVVEPYPYTLTPLSPVRDTVGRRAEPPVRYYGRVPLGEGELLISWDDGTTVLYLWGDTLKEVLRGRWMKAVAIGGRALVVGEDGNGGFYALVGGEGVLSLRRVDGPTYVSDVLICGRGVAYFGDAGVIWLDDRGNFGLSEVPMVPFGGKGCLNGLPYFSFLSDSSLLFVGADTRTLPAPEGVKGIQAFYGYGDTLLLIYGNGGGIRGRMWDGRGWVRTYVPWSPSSVGCYGPAVACVCLCPIAFPLVSTEGRCSINAPVFGPVAKGVKIGDRTYSVRFR